MKTTVFALGASVFGNAARVYNEAAGRKSLLVENLGPDPVAYAFFDKQNEETAVINDIVTLHHKLLPGAVLSMDRVSVPNIAAVAIVFKSLGTAAVTNLSISDF